MLVSGLCRSLTRRTAERACRDSRSRESPEKPAARWSTSVLICHCESADDNSQVPWQATIADACLQKIYERCRLPLGQRNMPFSVVGLDCS